MSLVATSWMANRFGMSLSAFLNVQWGGMMAAAAVAFIAMLQAQEMKWPAAVVLFCIAPVGLEVVKVLPELGRLIHYLGVPGALMVLGIIATAAVATWILVAALPAPPRPPRVPEARVVD